MCSSLYPCIYVNSHFERPEVGRELDFSSTASTLPFSVYKPGRPACRGVVGTLLSSPSCVSGVRSQDLLLARWPRGHGLWQLYSYMLFLGWTHVLRALVVSYICGQHVYRHVIIPPRPSSFLTLPPPQNYNVHVTGKAWNRG